MLEQTLSQNLKNIQYKPNFFDKNLIHEAITNFKKPIYYFDVSSERDEIVESKKRLGLVFIEKKGFIAIDYYNPIGKGKDNTVVYLGQDFSDFPERNSLFAVKISTQTLDNDYENERDILRYLGRLVGAFQINDQKYLISDLCQGRNLMNVCYDEKKETKFRLPPSLIYKIAIGLIKEVYKYHQEFGILIRDLKTENVIVEFLEEGNIIVHLFDFGTSCKVQEAGKESDCGTAGYQAPEVMKPKNDPNKPIYTISSDFYSVGVIIAELSTQANFFQYRQKLVDELNATKSDTVPETFLQDAMPDIFNENKEEDQYLPELISVIKMLTKYNPNSRPIWCQIKPLLKNLEKGLAKVEKTQPFKTSKSEPLMQIIDKQEPNSPPPKIKTPKSPKLFREVPLPPLIKRKSEKSEKRRLQESTTPPTRIDLLEALPSFTPQHDDKDSRSFKFTRSHSQNSPRKNFLVTRKPSPKKKTAIISLTYSMQELPINDSETKEPCSSLAHSQTPHKGKKITKI